MHSRVRDLLDCGWCHLYSLPRAQGPGRTEVGPGRDHLGTKRVRVACKIGSRGKEVEKGIQGPRVCISP